MFVERLTKQDWEEYAQSVICGNEYRVSSDVYFENVVDKMGNVESAYLDFYAVSDLMDDEQHVDMVVTDFDENFAHKSFFISKFGANYIQGYKRYLKGQNMDAQQKNNLIKECNDYYYAITYKPNDHQEQKSLDEYADVMVR